MRDHVDAIREQGAELVIVGNGSLFFAQAFAEDFDLDGPLLVDPDLRAYAAAGLRRGRVEILSPRLLTNALRALRSGFRQTEVQGDPWQLGGVFVIEAGGRIAYRHVSREAGDHAPVDEILRALGASTAGSAAADPESTAAALPSLADVAERGQRLLGRVLSSIADPLIVPSFDRTGFRIHSLNFRPEDLEVDLGGRRCLVTGANSGIGYETALGLAERGAEVVLLCRDAGRGSAAAERMRNATGNTFVSSVVLDVSDLARVREVGEQLASRPVDVLVHNAGMLADARGETSDGVETTFATHVLGPHLLTRVLRPALEKTPGARVVWVSSGGMYASSLQLDDVQWLARPFNGVTAYSEAKRAQVVLAELWADELRSSGVVVNAMHPGWADTPSVAESLPLFHRVTSAVLRTPEEGADTVLWLAASEAGRKTSGAFFFDRVERSKHLLPFTRERADDRERLWQLCERLCQGQP